MREKTEKLVITFHTTTEAIAMEKSCKEQGLPGRLIPVPRQISAGCGLSWSTEPQLEAEMISYMAERNLGYDTMGIYLI